jgi:hypothetical protein
MVSFFFIHTAGEWYHALESHDPIFPAHYVDIVEFPGGLLGLFWVNPKTQAGVLACADTFDICVDDQGKECYGQSEIHMALEQLKNDVEKQRIFYLVSMAMENTYAWWMVHYLQANVLNATRQAARIVDIRFAEEQWKVEVDNIFNASLAATQLQAYDYARGTYAPRPNGPSMNDYTPSILQDAKSKTRVAVEISKMFKFKNNAYKNIPAFWFWFVNVGCLVIFLSSRRFSTKTRRDQLIEAGYGGGYHDCLWITIFWKGVCVVLAKKSWRGTKRGWRMLKAAPEWTKRKTLALRGKMKTYLPGRASQSNTTDEESNRGSERENDTEDRTFRIGDNDDENTEAATNNNHDSAVNGPVASGEH